MKIDIFLAAVANNVSSGCSVVLEAHNGVEAKHRKMSFYLGVVPIDMARIQAFAIALESVTRKHRKFNVVLHTDHEYFPIDNNNLNRVISTFSNIKMAKCDTSELNEAYSLANKAMLTCNNSDTGTFSKEKMS